MIALLTSLFIWNLNSMLKQTELEALENGLWASIGQARQDAVFSRNPVVMRYDAENQAFVLVSGAVETPFAIDTSGLGEGVEIRVVFKEMLPSDGYRLVRGELVTEREIETVTFFPDGTCSPFSVDLQIADYVSSIQMDPWTGSQLTRPEDS